ncbi:MAG TPA: hypothetical protein VGC44_06755 [Longimicrobiales bacterium]
MMRRIVIVSLLCSVLSLWADIASAQRSTMRTMSDGTGANVSLFSRGFVRVFGAPPAPPPQPIVLPEMLNALCLERADAMLVYAALAPSVDTRAERTALALLLGGPEAESAGRTMFDALIASGIGIGEVDGLLTASHGLLAPSQPDVINVGTAVTRYNSLVGTAPGGFLMAPPSEFAALRIALGRLSAAANHAYDGARVYPGLDTRNIRYANGADWLKSGQPIYVLGATYTQYGASVAIGDRMFKQVAVFEEVPVYAEAPVTEIATVLYVPVRAGCSAELVPYYVEEKVIKKQSAK